MTSVLCTGYIVVDKGFATSVFCTGGLKPFHKASERYRQVINMTGSPLYVPCT